MNDVSTRFCINQIINLFVMLFFSIHLFMYRTNYLGHYILIPNLKSRGKTSSTENRFIFGNKLIRMDIGF